MASYVVIDVSDEPKEKLIQLLTELKSGLAVPPADRPGEPSHPEVAGWTEADLRRMYRESPRAMKAILRALADRPGDEVPIDDVAQAITHKPNANWNTVAGTLGAFGRRVKNRYGRSWPFEFRSDEERGTRYVMSPEIAEAIRRIASHIDR